MDTKNMIIYKYENGIYETQDLVLFVDAEELSKEQFKNITGYDYQGIIKNKGLSV